MRSVRTLAGILGLASATACVRAAPTSATTSRGCHPDLRLLLGACVPPAIAAQACGVASIASGLGILVREDETLVCPGGGELATGRVDDPEGGPRLGCLAPAAPRTVPCPVGSLPDAAGGAARDSGSRAAAPLGST